MDQLLSVVVLLHGAPEGFKPLNDITDAAFRRDVHEVLQGVMKRLMRLQRFAWPAILGGKELVLIGSPLSGKTLGHLVPCIDLLLKDLHQGKVAKGNGPVLLILCSGSRTCNEIQSICWNFVKQSSIEVKIIVAYGGGAENVEHQLVNGCHILISTPRCFLRLLAKGKLIVNFDRLRFLVFDEADILTLRFLPEVEQICCAIEVGVRQRPEGKKGLQVVVCGEKWCPGVEALAQSLSSPVICIGAYLEAIAYAQLKPQLHLVTEESRLQELCRLLKDSTQWQKALVVCEDEADAVAAVEALLPLQLPVLLAHDGMTSSDTHGVFEVWSWKKHVALVCTDQILKEMRFQGATLLVHLQLPKTSKSTFALRCSSLIDQLPCVFHKHQTKTDAVNPQMHIFISDTEKQPLPEIVRFLKRLGITVDPDLQMRANVAEIEKETLKDCVPLCYNTKAFGDCWNKSACIYRHVMCEKDKPCNIPSSGSVKLRVIYAHDPCNFSVRLLEHTDEHGNTTKIRNQLLSIARKLRLHYKDDANRVLLEKPKAHDLCAAEKPLNNFQRTEVLAITRVDKQLRPREAMVRFIDDGVRDLIKVDQLFELPEELKQIPPQSVEIFLCRIIPCDLDWNWGRATNKQVVKILSEADVEDRFLVGKIMLSLGHTLWLDSLECFQYLPTLKTSTIRFSLRRKLLDERLVMENPKHVQMLHRAAVQGGLSLPPPCTPCTGSGSAKAAVEARWAFLPRDEFSVVHFIVGDHPGRFFIRLQKFEDLVTKLLKKLQKLVDAKELKDRALFAGDFCVGRFPADGKWYRARVEDAQDDRLDLFFVDHGDRASVSKSEALVLPENLISQLPFQAIECCVAGVSPDQGEKWSDAAIDFLFELTAKPGTSDAVKTLYAKPLGERSPADCTGGHRYAIALIECSDEKRSILNQAFVAQGLAMQSPSQKELLEAVEIDSLAPLLDVSDREDDEDEDDEDEDDIPRPLREGEISFPEEEKWRENCDQEKKQAASCTPTLQPGSAPSPLGSELEERLAAFNFEEVDEDEILEFFTATLAHYKGQKHLPAPKSPCAEDAPSPHSTSQEQDSSSDSLSVSDTEDKDTCSGSDPSMPPLVSTTRRPLVLWRQSTYAVWLRVDLPGTEEYYLQWSSDQLHFWTVRNEEVYAFDLCLFGAIEPQDVTHSGGLFVQIKLPKMVLGVDWLRLTRQRRVPWVKVDYSAEHDREDEEVELQRQVNAHLKAVQEKQRRELKRQHEAAMIPADEASSTDSDTDSDISDLPPFQEEQYDPYDPFN